MKNSIHFMKYIIIIFLSLFFSPFCFADSIPTYKIGLEQLDYLPLYNTIESSNPKKGACIEILELFAKKNKDNFKLVFTPLPVSRLFQEFVDGSVDFKFPDNINWASDLKKKLNVHYSSAIAKYTDGTLVLAENKGKGIEKLKSLGFVRGFTPWDYLDLIKEKKVTESESLTMESLIKKNLLGRIDGIYLNVDVAQYQLKKMASENKLVYDPALPHTTGIYSISSIKYPQVIDKFNEFLNTSKKEISDIMKSYKLGN